MIRPMKILIITLLVGTLICACSQSDGENAESSELIPVAVSTIKLGTVKQSLRYSGDIHAEYELKVFSKISRCLTSC